MPNGPFDEYLTQSVKQQPTPQATGWETGPANIAFIAQKFLEGAKQSRAQKFLQQQEEQGRQQQGYQMAIKAIQDNPNLLPAKRQELMAPLMQGLIGQVTGAKENSKTTGHPFTDAIKNIFTNMTGGQMGGKAAPLDMAHVGTALTEMQNPENTIQHHLTAGSGELSNLLQSMGPNANAEDFMRDERVQAIQNRVRETTGVADWMWDGLKALPQNAVEANTRALEIQTLKDLQNPSTGPTPTISTTPIPGSTPIPRSIGVNVSPGVVNLDTINAASTREQDLLRIVPRVAPAARLKISDVTAYRDEKGNLFHGQNVTSTDKNYPSGVYDTATKQLVPSARPNVSGDVNSSQNFRLMALGDKFPQFTHDISGNPRDTSQTYVPKMQGGQVVDIIPVDIRDTSRTVMTDKGPRVAFTDPVSHQEFITDMVPVVRQSTDVTKGSDAYARDRTLTEINYASAAPTTAPPSTGSPRVATTPGIGTAPRSTPAGTPTATTGSTPPPPNGIFPPLKNLDDREKRQLQGITGSQTLSKSLRKILSEVDPLTGKPRYMNNDLSDAFKQRWSKFLYDKGIATPDGQLVQLANLTSIQGATPYTQGTTAYAMMKQIQEHLPKPEDTPMQMWEKLDTIDSYLPTAQKSIYDLAGTRVGPGRVVGPYVEPVSPPPTSPDSGWGFNKYRQGAAAGGKKAPDVDF